MELDTHYFNASNCQGAALKKQMWFLVIIILSILLLPDISAAEAVPPLPSSFYGRAKVNGGNIPEGTILKAVIDGEAYALAIVELIQGESVYSMDVPGDDSSTLNVMEGGKPGDTIQFLLGDNPARETGSWVSGTNLEMDLNFDVPTPVVMTASFFGTVKINDENPSSGTTIKAVINGITHGTCMVSVHNGNAVYALSVPGDDPNTPGIIEGGVNGDIVQFLIDNTPSDQTGTWVSESNTEINLTTSMIIDKNMIYFPLFCK